MVEGHVNEILTAPFQAYEMFGAAAGFVSPRISVPSSKVRTRSQDAMLQTTYEGITTNHTDPAGRVRIKYNDNEVSLEPRRLRADIADADRSDAQNMVGDIDMDSMEAIAYGLGLRWELNVATKAMKSASFAATNKIDVTGGGAGRLAFQRPFSDENSDLRAMVEVAINAVAENGGTMIDSILIPPGAMPSLANNKILRETLRYSRIGGLTAAMLAEYLSGEGRVWTPDDIIIPRCRHNKGDEINRKFGFVWDMKSILLFKRAESNMAIQMPFFMATYTFEGTPIIATRRATEFSGDIHEGLHWQSEEVEGYDRAYLIENVY